MKRGQWIVLVTIAAVLSAYGYAFAPEQNHPALTSFQIENIALVSQVWGFLKYHHPGVAAGQVDWDSYLLRALSSLLVNEGPEECLQVLEDWSRTLPPIAETDSAIASKRAVHFSGRTEWLRDQERLGLGLSTYLVSVFANRYQEESQHYVSVTPYVGNPVFNNERSYESSRPPSVRVRLLGLLRLWNIIEYWFPYRNLIQENWLDVLYEYIPRMAEADDWDRYRLELFSFLARIGDGHANLWSELDVLPPQGNCYLPIYVRFIDGEAVIEAFSQSEEAVSMGFRIGDVIDSFDQIPVAERLKEWAEFYVASNEPARLRAMARFFPRGPCGECSVQIDRSGELITIPARRIADDARGTVLDERPGAAFQRLHPDVAYLRSSDFSREQIADYLSQLSEISGLIIDLRSYPTMDVLYALLPHLIDEPVAFARFTQCDLANPGSFLWTEPLSMAPKAPYYDGALVLLVNESTMSRGEYIAMALRASPLALIVGSTTAGADGNVSSIPLPGGIRVMISGVGVFYPDKTPKQQVGIVPDVWAFPTVEGVREGRDEVLEAALRHLLGPGFDERTIRELARAQ